MKRLVTTLLMTLSFAMVISAAAQSNNTLPTPNTSVQTLDKIVAVVNNEAISESELNQAITNAKRQLTQAHQPIPPAKELRNGVLQQLIYHKIQMQLAKRADITVNDAQVNAAIASIAKNNNLSISQLKSKLASGGVTFTSFKKNIKQELIINQLQRSAVASNVKVSDAEVDAFLKQYAAQPGNANRYHVLDVLVSIPNNPSAAQAQAAKQTALQISKQLKNGVAPSQLKGGQQTDLGWLPLSQLPSVFVKQLQHMRVNGVSAPIKTDNGYHIIQLKGVKMSSHPQPTRQQVRQMLFQKKFQQALIKWLENMRETAYVKINP